MVIELNVCNETGGIGDGGRYSDCTGGAAGYIDKQIFGESHIYGSPTCANTYQTGAFDPEGTLGSLLSILLCYLGVQVYTPIFCRC
jgi:heparan-alpha-glucosaminide N-acetyltransferase